MEKTDIHLANEQEKDLAAHLLATSEPWPVVAMLCATAIAGYICRVNVSTDLPLFRGVRFSNF